LAAAVISDLGAFSNSAAIRAGHAGKLALIDRLAPPQKLSTSQAQEASIQARFGEDSYAIGRFVIDRARASGLNRKHLVSRLGYRDLGAGHRVLNNLLRTGVVPRMTNFAEHLAHALEVNGSILAAVIECTEWQRRDEERARVLAREAAYRAGFRPHLRAESSRIRPEPLFIAALVGAARLRHVPLSDRAWQLDAEERDAMVKRAICDHYQTQHGRIISFGEIVGYTLVTLPGYLVDFGTPFDLHGDRAGPMCVVQRLLEATLGTKRGDTRVTGLLKDVPIKTVQVDGRK
jgi:hypothetical protein